MPKCIAKMTLTLSSPNGRSLQNIEENKKMGILIVGNVKALTAYKYTFLKRKRISIEDDVYLNKIDEWTDKKKSKMTMTRMCFKKYFIPI